MPHVDVSPARIFYELEGNPADPCVTLLNGFSRTSSDFRALSRTLVEQHWRVLRLDNRGAGKTENPPGFTVTDMVNDVVALWKALGISRSHCLGISYGGVLCELLGATFPDKVASLILVSTTSSSFFFGSDEIRTDLSKYFSDRFAQGNPILFKSLVKETSKVFQDPVSRERSLQQRQALNKFDFTPLLHSIRAPTLILHGTQDAVITPEAAEILHRAIKASELQLVDEVGHLFLAEVPKLFSERVVAFLNAHR